MFEPPTASWCRCFEHKHKFYRHLFDYSNFHYVKSFALQKENIIQTIEFMFPFTATVYETPIASTPVLKQGDYVQLITKQGDVQYGCITYCNPSCASLDIFYPSYEYHPKIPGAIQVSSLVKMRSISVSYEKIKKRIPVVGGEYLNNFACLNWVKFKIPK